MAGEGPSPRADRGGWVKAEVRYGLTLEPLLLNGLTNFVPCHPRLEGRAPGRPDPAYALRAGRAWAELWVDLEL